MKVPEGVTFHYQGGILHSGDDIPEDLLKTLPDGHPLRGPAMKPTPPPAVDKGK